MFIDDFIFLIDKKDFQLDTEAKKDMLTDIIPSGLDNIMSFLDLNNRVFTTELTGQSVVTLPYDFTYPEGLKVEGAEYTRVDLKDLSSGNVYAVELNHETKRGYASPLTVLDVLSANIESLKSRDLNGYSYEIRDLADNVLASIDDSENIFYPKTPFTAAQQIKIEVLPGDDIIRIADGDILKLKTEFAVLELSLRNGVTQYFVAEDGSTYQEQALTTLISRSRPSFKNFRLHFFSDLTGTVEMSYVRSLPKYINASEDEPLIDLYKLALKAFCLKELYFSKRKTQTAAIWERKYQQELTLLAAKKGKMKEFRKARRVAPNFTPFRLPFQS